MVVEEKQVIVALEESNLSHAQMVSFFQSLPSELKMSVGLMGGWAVTYLLKKRKVEHIGSRDIDIFFNSDCVDYKKITRIIESQGFQPHSTFRWAKFYDRRNSKQISEEQSRTIEQHNLVIIYLDLAAPDPVDPHVMHEPLLSDIFKDKFELWDIGQNKILMPNVEVMTKMKIKSAPQRVDDFKKQKDLIDLIVILRNDNSLWLTENGVDVRLRDDLRDSYLVTLRDQLPRFQIDGTIRVVADNLGLDSNVVIGMLQRL